MIDREEIIKEIEDTYRVSGNKAFWICLGYIKGVRRAQVISSDLFQEMLDYNTAYDRKINHD